MELEFPVDIACMRLNRACLLLLAEGGRVFVQLGVASGKAEVEELA